MLQAAISSDIDTLESIYKGKGCRKSGGYTGVELRMGLDRFLRFLEPYGGKATLFMVGNDFLKESNRLAIKDVSNVGCEIANHTMTHAQGFRLLDNDSKEREVADMEKVCEEVTGRRPMGFRSPGWNIGDDAIAILKRRGYSYDSSVFPTSVMPLLKLMHRNACSSCARAERSTMGQMSYMRAPLVPYRSDSRTLRRVGVEGIVEFPITVSPVLRLPFFATYHLARGYRSFKETYKRLRACARPIQYQMHLSDFVDYDHPDLAEQVPQAGRGVYVPQALRTPLDKKIALFKKVLDTIAEDYSFTTLAEWSKSV